MTIWHVVASSVAMYCIDPVNNKSSMKKHVYYTIYKTIVLKRLYTKRCCGRIIFNITKTQKLKWSWTHPVYMQY